MPRNARSVCSGCGKSFNSSLRHRAKNILLRLFVSARSSKHLELIDYVCKKYYSKFVIWIKKGKGMYNKLLNFDFSTDANENDEIREQVGQSF